MTVSSGGIRNVALAAAFLAAEARRPVTMADVLHAVRREFQKLGKALWPDEPAPPAPATG